MRTKNGRYLVAVGLVVCLLPLFAQTGGGPGRGQKTMANSAPVTMASDQSVLGTNISQVGGTAVVADPCQALAKTPFVISLTTNTKLITGTSLKKTYLCSLNLVVAAATNVALVEGTGSTCGTGTAGMAGGATAATGWNFAANGGMAHGAGGAWVFGAATAADDVCLFVSAANQVSGGGSYVQQ